MNQIIYKHDGIDVTRHRYSPWLVFSAVWSHRELLFQLIKRDIAGRYRGSWIGGLWAFIYPILMLAVYTLVFGVFLQSKWVKTQNSLEFSLVLFVGLIIFNLFEECLTRAPTLILANPNYVKKVIFPLEILPWVAMGTALFHTVISLIAWTLFFIIIHGKLYITILYLPLLLAPLVIVIIGLCYFITSIGVFFRDINQFISVITRLLIFLSPVFYPIQNVPPSFQAILLANPITFIVEEARRVMIDGNAPHLNGVYVYTAAGLLILIMGFAWFQKTRDGFADVL